MAGPWEKYQQAGSQTAPPGPWTNYDRSAAPVPAPAEQQPWKGGFLPYSGDRPGEGHWDWNAGITGMAKDAAVGAYQSLTGLSGAIEDTLSGAPVTTDMQQKAIEAAPLAVSVNPAVRSGSRAIEGVARTMLRSRPPVPGAAELVEAGGAQLTRAKGMGVEYDPQAVAQLLGSIKQRLIREGFREKQTPATFDILSEIPPASAAGERVVTDLGDLHSTRMALGNAAKNFQNPQEQGTAARAIEILDEFIKAPPAASVVAGPATAAGEEFAQGIGNYAAGMRSARLRGFDEDSFV
jgi:hypothetical protein